MSVIVASFLAHLKELEESMKVEETCFKQEDIENCDVLAGLLQDLVNIKFCIHNKIVIFELHTIKGKRSKKMSRRIGDRNNQSKLISAQNEIFKL
jgi:hypothetical protein